jgi:hypothetical protein
MVVYIGCMCVVRSFNELAIMKKIQKVDIITQSRVRYRNRALC